MKNKKHDFHRIQANLTPENYDYILFMFSEVFPNLSRQNIINLIIEDHRKQFCSRTGQKNKYRKFIEKI